MDNESKVACVWHKTDPRVHFMYSKHAEIIVSNGVHAYAAHVETKHDWTVGLYSSEAVMNALSYLDEDESWPSNWVWTELPTVTP